MRKSRVGSTDTAHRPMARLLRYLCLVGIVLGAVQFSGRLLTPTAVQEATPASPGEADALRRARLLCWCLTHDASLPLVVEHNVIPATAGSTGQKRVQARDEWVIQSNDGDPTAAFLVIYDAHTGALKRLSWSVLGGIAPQTAEGVAAGRGRLDAAGAAAATRRVLHQLGIPEADGPWTVVSVNRSSPSDYAGQVWNVYLISAHWSVWSYLDPGSAELLQILVLPAGEHTVGHSIGSDPAPK